MNADMRAAQAEALRVAARCFVEDMAGVWGGDSQWLTTGTRVAEVAACVLREMAADMESECEWCGQRGDHANGCRLGLGPDERGPHRPDCNCAPPYADCVHPPCDCTECAHECSGSCGDHQWLDRPESDTRECLICGVEVAG